MDISEEQIKQMEALMDQAREIVNRMVDDGIAEKVEALAENNATGLNAFLTVVFVDGVESGEMRLLEEIELEDNDKVVAMPSGTLKRVLLEALAFGVNYQMNSSKLDKLWDVEVSSEYDKVREND